MGSMFHLDMHSFDSHTQKLTKQGITVLDINNNALATSLKNKV